MISFPLSSYRDGLIPKKGRVAEPGLVGVTPAIGDIRIDPVSVCHQVSMTSHELLPTISNYQCHASGLMGSPTVPKTLRLSLLVFKTGSFPYAIKALIAVGAV